MFFCKVVKTLFQIGNWNGVWSTGYWILDPYGMPFWILMLHTIKFPVHYNINSDR